MTDAQMAILSKIAYLDKNPPYVNSLSDLIKYYENQNGYGDYAEAFNVIRTDPTLNSLKITGYENKDGWGQSGFAAYCFETVPGGEAVVAFRGTQIGDVTGDVANDVASNYGITKQQMDALNFMNNVVNRYGNAEVTGHSLGGQLAQFASLFCGGVSNCVAFNPVGFSDDFMKTYKDLINRRKGVVKIYRSKNDGVTGKHWWAPVTWVLPQNHIVDEIEIDTSRHTIDNVITWFNDRGDYDNGGGGGGSFGGGEGSGGFRGSSNCVLKVTPAHLISTANTFKDSGNRVAKLSAEILALSVQLRSVWDGEAPRTYIHKLGKLNDDTQRMCGMINEHVNDLNDMAARYSAAEIQNISISNALAEEVIF